MTMIELGVVAPGSEPEPDPVASRMRRIDLRRIGVAVVTLLCVLTVTGSARPEPRSMRVLWSTQDADRFLLTRNALYTLAPGLSSLLTKRDAGTGEIRWSKRLPELVGWLGVEIAGAVLVPAGQGEQTFAGVDGLTYRQPVVLDTVALDAVTGAVRWRQRGEVSLANDETVLLGTWSAEGDQLTSQRLVRSADGSVIWDHRLSDRPVSGWATIGADPARPEGLVSVTQDGLLEVYRYADGRRLGSRQVPWQRTAESDEYAYLFGVGDTVYTVRTDDGEQDVTAYDVPTLAERWSLRVGAGPGMFACGRVVCVGAESGGVDGRDPRTGRLLWHSDGWDWARPIGAGRLLAESRNGDRTGLVDETTGRIAVELGRGMTVADEKTGQVLVLGSAKSPPYGFTISQLDSTGEIILRGRMGLVSDLGCQLAAGRFACAAAGGELVVRDVG